MENNFYGSKLNTVLLFILIILMGVAIYFMLQNKELYLHPLDQKNQDTTTNMDNVPAEVTGNKADLVSFSVPPGQKVSGKMKFTGSVKNNYFFEGNIIVNILDANNKLLKQGHGTSTSDWMTSGPVFFETELDFTGLPKGPGYIEIHNDNPSDLPANNKSILLPIVIQ